MTTTTFQTDRFEVGQIVCSSYGYNMTLVQFYIVDRMTKASVWLRPVECRVFGDDGGGEGRAIPNTGWQAPDNAVFRKRIHETDGKQWLSDSIKYFCIWNGKPEYYNSWD